MNDGDMETAEDTLVQGKVVRTFNIEGDQMTLFVYKSIN